MHSRRQFPKFLLIAEGRPVPQECVQFLCTSDYATSRFRYLAVVSKYVVLAACPGGNRRTHVRQMFVCSGHLSSRKPATFSRKPATFNKCCLAQQRPSFLNLELERNDLSHPMCYMHVPDFMSCELTNSYSKQVSRRVLWSDVQAAGCLNCRSAIAITLCASTCPP